MPSHCCIFIRHGESAANAGLKTASNAEIPLTETGHKQAKHIIERIDFIPDHFYSSPFKRAIDTLHPLAAKFPDKPVMIRDSLHEFIYLSPAKYDGTTAEERKQAVNAFWANCDPDYQDGADAESFHSFVERVRHEMTFFQEQRGMNIVVGHGQFMHIIRLLRDPAFKNYNIKQLMAQFMPEWLKSPINNTDFLAVPYFTPIS